MASKLSKLIDRHLDFYKRSEKTSFDKARRFYRGDFFANTDSDMGGTRMDSYLCSKNLIYARDTAVSALGLGPNPTVAAVAEHQNHKIRQRLCPVFLSTSSDLTNSDVRHQPL